VIRRLGVRRLLAPILAFISAVTLIILWTGGQKRGIDLLASLVNALLFLAVGIVIRDINLYKSSYRSFLKIFLGVQEKFRDEGDGSFYVVLPHFTINPDVQKYINSVLNSRDGASKRVFDLYRNPSVYRYMRNHKVTLDVALAGTDSEAGILLATAVGKLTQGSFTPIFMTDEIESVKFDKPAILLGLYSNAWVHAYWEHMRRSGGVFKPLENQVGFWVRSGPSSCKKFLPLDEDDHQLVDFWAQDSPDIATDYAVVARVRGNTAPTARNAVWIVCAGIGKAGTHAAAQYLTRESVLHQIISDFSDVPEFALVLEVSARNPVDTREIHSWPPGLRKVENDSIQRSECSLLEASPDGSCSAGNHHLAPSEQ
jgi:hypothetical protein